MCRALLLAALFVPVPLAPLLAQQPAPGDERTVTPSDTAAGRRHQTLFTYRDAILAGAFVVGTVAAFPFDKHYAIQLQDTARQDSRFYNDVANTVRTIAEPGAWIIGGSLYAVGKLAEVVDGGILALGGLLSGHTLKHLLAAAAAALIVRWLAPGSRHVP